MAVVESVRTAGRHTVEYLDQQAASWGPSWLHRSPYSEPSGGERIAQSRRRWRRRRRLQERCPPQQHRHRFCPGAKRLKLGSQGRVGSPLEGVHLAQIDLVVLSSRRPRRDNRQLGRQDEPAPSCRHGKLMSNSICILVLCVFLQADVVRHPNNIK